MLSYEVEELGCIRTVGDFVVYRQGHVHQLSHQDIAIVGHAGISYLADSQDAALAGYDYRSKRLYPQSAEVADGNAAALKVCQSQLVAAGPFYQHLTVTCDLLDILFVDIFNYRCN